MGSDQESLNNRIRETVSGLSDEDLSEMQRAPREQYTAFARKVAAQELTRRREMRVQQHSGFGSDPGVDPEALRERSEKEKRAGCYIEVWSEKNFEGEHLRIQGPAEHQALESDTLNWCNTISSLRVGATAFVLVYAERDFGGEMLSFGPGQDVANLDELKFDDEIDSIRLVNSMKVFDELREDTSSLIGERPSQERLSKEVKQGKKRGRRNL